MFDKLTFAPKNIYDVEQSMMECWNVVDDIKALYYSRDRLSEDDVDNYLLGLFTIYQVKFEKMQSTLEEYVAHKNET
jgi:hypothetical protein